VSVNCRTPSEVLESRFFATDPPRTDIKLQLARLASVLHYYADRSVVH
jgi:DNA phosphorothioation-dependent restriction protein DptH